MKKTTTMLMMLVFLVGGFASDASAFTWSDLKEKVGLGEEVRQMDKTGREFGIEVKEQALKHGQEIDRGVKAINSNGYYTDIADVMGYERVCLEISDSEEDEKFTLFRQGRNIVFQEECSNTEFTAKVDGDSLTEFVNGLESGDKSVLTRLYAQDKINVPWNVKVNAFRKCVFSDLC